MLNPSKPKWGYETKKGWKWSMKETKMVYETQRNHPPHMMVEVDLSENRLIGDRFRPMRSNFILFFMFMLK
jgi:hypothetical protein